jgi:phenylalanyl-tRNA synthetase beta subunit
LPYAKIDGFIKDQLEKAAQEHGYIYELNPLDIFTSEDAPKLKHTTWRIILIHPDKTLTTDESNKLLDKIASEVKKSLKAERI